MAGLPQDVVQQQHNQAILVQQQPQFEVTEPVVVQQQQQVVRRFDPEAHELHKDFRLTRYTELKGWGCKVPREALLNLLKGLEPNEGEQGQGDNAEYMQVQSGVPKFGKYLPRRVCMKWYMFTQLHSSTVVVAVVHYHSFQSCKEKSSFVIKISIFS